VGFGFDRNMMLSIMTDIFTVFLLILSSGKVLMAPLHLSAQRGRGGDPMIVNVDDRHLAFL
jgi:hypothetical protein